ncbi:hypothetical protein FV232_25650 [Methylobacterium sp. WL30]|jgi:hypothetical protein|uniref:hypothetical protein n=1 Tax=unclassified Methylobacterium TaxID=2615210 RepID=UPI0011C8B84C|nr:MULTISPECIES: hypothetical protein [unclassified Methylobacterium]MCJ2008249.1 hypothetical protein [Methylobacterium sp. J-092]MCJ2042171.1 hypothetical protein [Methylobacterium sp. J-059]MCJ2075321.1 hypothetical protein [Methylobacterium sp. E-016]MCJ2113789.1 hypothetical protein [Methylobacterium sp. E-025]TXN19751.1 hypothetical protein FV225_28095 [Methylobacterium sp. WL93]
MQQGYERFDRDADWEDARPRRRSAIGRVFGLLKLVLFLAPIALFAASYLVTDCGSRSGGGLGQLLKAGACARNEMLNRALSLPDDLGTLRRAMN